MDADRPSDVIALEHRCRELEANQAFLARGLQRALSGQARFTEQDTERLLRLVGEDE